MDILTGGAVLFAGEAGAVSKAVQPQPVISLDQAISLVKKEYPDIRLQEIAVEKASEEVKLATRAFLPDIDVDYIASSASGGLGLILTAAKLFTPVFSFKKLMIEKEVSRILEKKEEVLVRSRELEAAYGVKELYATLLLQRELSRILLENEKRSEKRFELVEIHHTEGGLNDEELLKEKLDLETARAEARKTKTWREQSEYAFKRLLGLPRDEALELAPIPVSGADKFPMNLEECFRAAYEHNPVVTALLLEEEASLKRLGKKDPRFRVDGAFIGLGESSGGLFSGRPRFGVTGNFVLYDWGKDRLKKKILGLEHSELVLKHEKEIQAFESAITKSYFELERLQNEIAESGTKLELFRESKRREDILGEMGRKRQTDLLSFENEYAVQETKDFQKHLEYFLVRERLIKDMGLFSLDELKEAVAQ